MLRPIVFLVFFLVSVGANAQSGDIDGEGFFCATEGPSRLYGTFEPPKVWMAKDLLNTGSTPGHLRIAVEFLGDATEIEKNFVKRAILKWNADDAADGVEWVFDQPGEGHIRVLFTTKWPRSLVGTDALKRDADETTRERETMLLPRGAKLSEFVVLHEFGHALGLQHEQLNPNVPFAWITHQIFKDQWNKMWCEHEQAVKLDQVVNCLAQIENQITLKTSAEHACPGATAFDKYSIMLYGIPDNWLESGAGYSRPTRISSDDKQCVRGLYRGSRSGGGTDGDVSAIPSSYRKLYRQCLTRNLHTCNDIEFVENDGRSLEFRSFGEPRGEYYWAWQKTARNEYRLDSATRGADGQTLSRSGSLVRKRNFVDGTIDWPNPCHGEAYVRLANRCP